MPSVHYDHPYFLDLLLDQRLVDVAEKILGPDIALSTSRTSSPVEPGPEAVTDVEVFIDHHLMDRLDGVSLRGYAFCCATSNCTLCNS
jgi:hypothetical protein